MKVLSLFDGISCGMVALEKAGILVERYVAYEIEPNAIKISKKNYPQIEHCGDVTTADFTQYEGFDLLIGGSSCQSLSIVQSKTRQHLDGKSKLFFEFVRAKEEMHPKYFLFENVASMNDESKQAISECLGCAPIFIDSGDFSAQERPRYYWTNIPVLMNYEKSKLVLRDVLESNVDEKYFYNYSLINIDLSKQVCATMDFKNHDMHKRIFNPDYKVHTLTTCGGGNTQKKVYIDGRARKLTPLEYERLQTLPDNYTFGVADGHRYNACGNGWTVDVIAHIFTFIPKEEERKNEMELKVIDVQLPEQITFNYEELKTELMAKVSVYQNMVYSEAQIKDAKADRANLNKLKKALNDERIRREKEYMQPFNDFKAKINEIITIIDKPVLMIDSQVKAFEEQKKAEKQMAIEAYFEGRNPFEWLNLKQIFNEKWLNASVKMPDITTVIDSAIEQIEKDLETLRNLPEFGFEAVEEYKQSLDLNKAISEGHRLSEIQKRKAEEAARMENAAVKPTPSTAIPTEPTEAVEPQPEQQKQWVSFKAFMSIDDALALREFFISRNIEFEAI